MARSEGAEDDLYWGSRAVNLDSRDLPRLKAEYLIAGLPRSGRVLEVGCGGGRLLHTVARYRPNLELFGVDIRPLRLPTSSFEFRLVGVDDDHLPFDPSSFDVVVLFDVLEHVADPAKSLAAAHRVLRPGGELISFVPLEDNPISFYRFYRRLFGDDLYVATKDHRHAFSEKSLDAILAPLFDVRDRTYLYHFLGQFMDATMFAALRNPSLRRRVANDNPYYQDDDDKMSRSGLVESMMRFANAVACRESQLLARSRRGSAGIMLRALAL